MDEILSPSSDEPPQSEPAPPSVAHIVEIGYRMLPLGRPEAARAAFEAALQIDPGSPDAHLGLASTFSAMADYKRMAIHARKAHALENGSGRTTKILAQALIDTKRNDEARLFLKTVLERYPADPDLLEIAGVMELTTADPFEGLRLLEQSKIHGAPFRLHIAFAAVPTLALMGQFSRARAFLSGYDEPEAITLRAFIDRWESTWRQLEAREELQRIGREELPAMIRSALSRADMTTASHLARRLFVAADATPDDFLMVSQVASEACAQGYDDMLPLISKGRAAAMFSTAPTPAAVAAFGKDCVARFHFREAGEAFLRLVDEPVSPLPVDDLLRAILFCTAAGGVNLADAKRACEALVARGTGRGLAEYAHAALKGLAGDLSDPPHLPESAFDAAMRLTRRRYARQRLMRPRIALCLSGQLRGYAATWPLTRAALAPYDATVFVATWAHTGNGMGAAASMDRVLPPGFAAKVPSESRSRIVLEARYPSLYGLIVAAGSEVNEADLKRFFGTEHVRILDEPAFERDAALHPGLFEGRPINQSKMYFGMSEVLAMRSEHELHHGVFDIVIRGRPDRAILELSEIDLAAVHDRRVMRNDQFYDCAVGDQISVSNSAVADEIGDIWPMMRAAGSFACFPGASGRHAEYLMSEALVRRGVKLEPLARTRLGGLTSMTLDPLDVLGALLADAAAMTTPTQDDQLMIDAAMDTVLEAQDHDRITRARALLDQSKLRIAKSVAIDKPVFSLAEP